MPQLAAPGYNTSIPEKIMTPDKVETSIGTLEFQDGRPSETTAAKVFDYIDTARGVETFLNGIPATSIEGLRLGFIDLGAKSFNQAVIFDKLADSNPLFLTANSETVYVSVFFDLKKDGPMVIEVPPKSGPGTIDDAFFRFVVDMGPPGPDRGAGGKYLILPPEYEGPLEGPIGGKAAEVGGQKYSSPSRQPCELAHPARVPGQRQARRRGGHVQERRQGLSTCAGRQSARDGVLQRLRKGLQHHPCQQLRVLRRAAYRHRARAGLAAGSGAARPVRLHRHSEGQAVRAGCAHEEDPHGCRRHRQCHGPGHDVPVAAVRRPGLPEEPMVPDHCRRQPRMARCRQGQPLSGRTH